MLSHSSKYSELTDAQCSKLGRAIIESSNIEYMLEAIIIRLCMAPDFPALAVTSRLSGFNKAESLKALIDTHKRRYRSRIIGDEVLNRLSMVIKKLNRLRFNRNRFAHYLWCRNTDESVFGVRFIGKQAGLRKEKDNSVLLSLSDIDRLSEEMKGVVNQLIEVFEKLPKTQDPLDSPSAY